MEEFIWTTKDGRDIPLSEIDDQHLHNIAQMMRRGMSAVSGFARILQGEVALETIDSDIVDMRYDYDIVCAEIERRGGDTSG